VPASFPGRFLVHENEKRQANPKSKQEPLQVESQHAFNWMIYPFVIHDMHKLEWFLAALRNKFPHEPTAAEATAPRHGERTALPAYHS
jgi:hypothetical protein